MKQPGANISYAMTGGSAAREAELQKTLQSLLERYNGSLMPNSFVQGAPNTGWLFTLFKMYLIIEGANSTLLRKLLKSIRVKNKVLLVVALLLLGYVTLSQSY